MAKKEVKTDLWVARQLDDSQIKYDAQGSNVKEINDALQSASKRGTGNVGYPEYVAVVKDFVIVIEDKADLTKHQKLTDSGILSVDQKDIATIISQLHNYFIHRLVNNEDIRAIGKAVAFIDNTSYEMISVLPQGACIFTGVASNFPVLVQVDLLPKQQQPQSSTINLTELWKEP